MKAFPKAGDTCPALSNEDYEYKLSGDLGDTCQCIITKTACIGRVISDDENQSSPFFSRARPGIDTDKIKKCPLYEAPKEVFKPVLQNRISIESKARESLQNNP